MTAKIFEGNFTQQEPLPEDAIARAVEVMRSGRLHRYNVAEGETSETVLLEKEFAVYMGVDYCLACASGGYALHIALRAFGLAHGEPVLTNAFTLSPVPGAIVNAGGKPVLVETTDDLVIDLDDLAAKIETSGARILMLSHMRGHIVDMDALMTVIEPRGVALIEDCAHTMGASWNGIKSGLHGIAACYSTQTYKHVNSGEGGLLITRDPEIIARATILSGSYMLYGRHETGPDEAVFADILLDTPNCSGRMDNLRAAILRPQLALLDENVKRWNARYAAMEEALGNTPGIRLIQRPPEEYFVGSSFQFVANDLAREKDIHAFLDLCLARGVELKWFGAPDPHGYTSRHDSWRYAGAQSLPKTDRVLSRLFDVRIPLTFDVADCTLVGEIIRNPLCRCAAAMRSHKSPEQQDGQIFSKPLRRCSNVPDFRDF
ncbi:MAG: DegT/DnrJ/EryC1/StrS family aminotransferase, partial [Hyphomicrobiaceae bacterium]